jgi:peptidoglycan/xylan/chitin deacetylase (PgdA/CDA1 family)
VVNAVDNLIAMYHYVRDGSAFNCLTTAQFRQQVTYLASTRRCITLRELLEQQPADPTCIITFDDGLRDGYTNALPVLQELGVPAVFFVPTAVLAEDRVLAAQKRHYLLAALGGAELAGEFNALVPEEMRIEALEELRNRLDDVLTSSVKYFLDNLDRDLVEQTLDRIFARHFDEGAEFRATYLSRADIEELIRAGMEIGAHGHEHRWLGQLYYRDQEQDIRRSVEVMSETLGHHPRIMSYPFGSYTIMTRRLAAKYGFQAAITTRKHLNEGLDHPLELGRFDCIDLPPLARQ